MIGYQAQVLPAILAGFTLVYLERFFRKICPSVVSMIVVPFLSLTLSVMIAHFILGPIGWTIGTAISNVVNAGLTSNIKSLFGAVFGFVYAPLVITGLHHMSNAIDLQLIADFGGTTLWPMIALSNIAQGSAVLGMIFLQKHDEKAKEVSIPACISCYLGVTEPAMFGVNIKYGFPFLCGMIGSAIAGCICVTTGITAHAIGVGGLPGILSIQPQYMLLFALCSVIAVAVPLVLTLTVGRKKYTGSTEASADTTDEPAAEAPAAELPAGEVHELKAFLTGKAVPIEEVPDAVFSSKTLGDGMAIDPVNDVLTAPADGTVTIVMEGSNHACGLRFANGTEILLHIGLDTVDMNGDGFEPLVTVGDVVKAGDPLIRFSQDKIKAAGHPSITIMVITEMGDAKEITFHTGNQVEAASTVIADL